MRSRKLVWLSSVSMAVGLAACSLGSSNVKVRAVEHVPELTGLGGDNSYESAKAAIDARDYGRALDYLQAARLRSPDDPKVLNAMGVVYDKLGRFDLSARYYAQARAADPGSAIVARNMAYSNMLQGLTDQPAAKNLADAVPAPSGIPIAASPPAAKPPLALAAAGARGAEAFPPVPSMSEPSMPGPSVSVSKAAINQPVATPTPAASDPASDTKPSAPAASPMPAAIIVASKVAAKPEPAPRPAMDQTVSAPAPALLKAPAEASLSDPAPAIKVAVAQPPAMPAPEAPKPVPVEKKPLAASMPAPKAEPVAAPVEAPAKPVPVTKVVQATPVPPSVIPQRVAVETVPVGASIPLEPVKAMPVAAKPHAAPSVKIALAEPIPAPAAETAKPVLVEKKPAAAAIPSPKFAPAQAKPVKPAPLPAAQWTLAAPAAAPGFGATTHRTVPSGAGASASAAAPKRAESGAERKIVTIGHPILMVNASGRPDLVANVGHRLSQLGWSLSPPKGATVHQASVLYFPPQNSAAAQALQHTLPFPVRLVADPRRSMQLMIGRDYLSWKPRNARLAALWLKPAVVAALTRPPQKGIR
jgi:hypothetical protein